MELEIRTKWSKSERERQIQHDITSICNLKYHTHDPIYKTEKDHGHGEQTCVCQGKEGQKRLNGEFGVGRCQLLHFKQLGKRILLYSTGNCVQSLGLEHDGRQYYKKRMCVCVCGGLDHLAVSRNWKNTACQLCFNWKIKTMITAMSYQIPTSSFLLHATWLDAWQCGNHMDIMREQKSAHQDSSREVKKEKAPYVFSVLLSTVNINLFPVYITLNRHSFL